MGFLFGYKVLLIYLRRTEMGTIEKRSFDILCILKAKFACFGTQKWVEEVRARKVEEQMTNSIRLFLLLFLLLFFFLERGVEVSLGGERR